MTLQNYNNCLILQYIVRNLFNIVQVINNFLIFYLIFKLNKIFQLTTIIWRYEIVFLQLKVMYEWVTRTPLKLWTPSTFIKITSPINTSNWRHFYRLNIFFLNSWHTFFVSKFYSKKYYFWKCVFSFDFLKQLYR